MQCERTGAEVFSTEYNEYFYGDLYHLDGSEYWVLKTAGNESRKPMTGIIHARFYYIEAKWIDLKPYGILISSNVAYYGYEGVPV